MEDVYETIVWTKFGGLWGEISP